MNAENPPRPPRSRPKLAVWIWARGYLWAEAGELFGVTGEAVRLWCLPFDDDKRRTPGGPMMVRITERTGGDIQPEDFYPTPPLSPAEAATPFAARSA